MATYRRLTLMIELREMVMQQPCCLWNDHPPCSTIPAGIIPLRLLQHSKMGDISRDQRLWLNDNHRLGTPLQLLRADFLGYTG
ncbi:MAG: hypothetical protein HP494_14095 [Nitrospira sp.]|nr:hypothetical protein [Nitrospira sp.]